MKSEDRTGKPNIQEGTDNASSESNRVTTGDVRTGSGDFVGRDKYVYGDEVRGDKIVAGDVKDSVAVAVGHGAVANVHLYYNKDQPTPRELRNRKAMLQLVKSFWIEGVLEKSLYREVLIDLNIEHKSDLIANPFNTIAQEIGRIEHLIAPGAKIIDIFDQMNQSLLILGQPGMSKTTHLLLLTYDLITRAQNDVNQPIPVVFNLSSWANKQESISVWLVDELQTKYNIPTKIAQAWVDTDSLVLLLDGLDEVDSRSREQCVRAINSFRSDHLIPIAICSRVEEYMSLATQLNMRGVILIQPPNESHIDKYIEAIGLKDILGEMLKRDNTLLELAQNPLLLNTMAFVCGDELPQELASFHPRREDYHTKIFNAYVKKMFKRRNLKLLDSPQQTIHYLRWLARRLIEHNQTLLLIERIQPSWLETRTQELQYNFFAAMIAGVRGTQIFRAFVAGILILWSIPFFFGTLKIQRENLNFTSFDYLFYMISLLPASMLIGNKIAIILAEVVMGLIGGFIGCLMVSRPIDSRTEAVKWICMLLSSIWIIGGIIYLIYSYSLGDSIIMLLKCVVYLLEVAGILGGAFYYIQKNNKTVHTIERLQWSWAAAARGITQLENYIRRFGPMLGPTVLLWLPFYYVGATMWGLWSGLSFADIELRGVPNVGIRRSLSNSLILGAICGVSGAIISIGIIRFMNSMLLFSFTQLGILLLLEVSFSFWVIGSLHFGGFAVFKHLILRFLLWRYNYAPLNYINFLDYSTERLFLRKVGGGYIFIHRMLMEYFASLTDDDIERITVSSNSH